MQTSAPRALAAAIRFIVPDGLERLADVADADVALARGTAPLCTIYSRACTGAICERLEFVNVNTPHDYERAQGMVERQPEPNEDRITTGRHRPMTDTTA